MATFRIVRVVDDRDPLADADPPPGARIYRDGTPRDSVHFARISPLPGESLEGAEERTRAWLRGIRLPRHQKFELQPTPSGLRTYLVESSPLVTEGDVVRTWSESAHGGHALMHVTLTREAAARLERAADGSRFAFVVNGFVQSAPRMRSGVSIDGPISFEASPRRTD